MTNQQDNQSNYRAAIWIPVIVSIISGIFALWQASISSSKASEAGDLLSSNKPLPVGTIVASFLSPKEFYKLMDRRETFDKDKSTWCHANGDEVILDTPYFNSRGNGDSKIENLQGYFLRGHDPSRSIDQETRELGSIQVDATKLPKNNFTGATSSNGVHDHTIDNFVKGSGGEGLAHGNNYFVSSPTSIKTSSTGHNHTLIVNGVGDSETRPKNISVNYFIKIR